MDLNLEDISLEVRAHRSTSDTNAKSWAGVETGNVCRGLSNCLRCASGGWHGSCCARSQQSTNAFGFDAHPDETCEPVHDGDGDVLDLFGGEGIAWVCAESFHPGVGETVGEDDG